MPADQKSGRVLTQDAAHGLPDGRPAPWASAAVDLSVTLLLWAYFTACFVVFFAPFYLLAYVFTAGRPHAAFQRLNHYFYRGFFLLCRLLIPRHEWHVDEAVRAVRSSVIVCNHVSYIDPLLLIALYGRHTTIVKGRLFAIPVFGRMLKLSGYLPASTEGGLADLMLRRMETLPADLARGANLFVFPEGTRGRSGSVGRFNPGAFKIARLCRAPIKVIMICNADRLFTPGRFLFNTRVRNRISLSLVAEIAPDSGGPGYSTAALIEQVRACMLRHADLDTAAT